MGSFKGLSACNVSKYRSFDFPHMQREFYDEVYSIEKNFGLYTPFYFPEECSAVDTTWKSVPLTWGIC